MIKLNVTGDKVWQRCIGGTGDEIGESLAITSNNEFLITGSTKSKTGNFSTNHGGTDLFTMKVSNAGDLIWQKCLGGEKEDLGYAILETPDKGSIMVGSTTSDGGDVSDKNGKKDIWVVKLRSNQTIEWQRCLGGWNDEEAYDIKEIGDEGYIICGYTLSNDMDVSGWRGGRDIWIVKLSSKGDIIWQRCLGGTSDDEGYSVAMATDGGLVVSGYTKSSDRDVSNAIGSSDIWVIKLSGTGEIEWEKTLGGLKVEQAQAVIAGSDMSYSLIGYTYSNSGNITGKYGGTSNSDIWIVKLSPPPTITTVNPSIGQTSQTIQIEISGTGFRPGAKAYLTKTGEVNIQGEKVTVPSHDTIICFIPIGTATPGLWSLQVTNPDGRSGYLPDTFIISMPTSPSPTLPPTPLPAPTITSITPSTGQTSQTVQTEISGTGFRPGVIVYLTKTGEVNIQGELVTVPSNDKIICSIPIGTAAPGLWSLQVTNSDKLSGYLPDTFTISKPPSPSPTSPPIPLPGPAITSINPSSGNREETVQIAINGYEFRDGIRASLFSEMTIIPCTDIEYNSGVMIRASFLLPADCRTGLYSIAVTNPDGQSASLSDCFTIKNRYPPPTITNISPDNAEVGDTIALLIKGTDFLNGSTIKYTRNNSLFGPFETYYTSKLLISSNISISHNISIGLWNLSVTNPDGQSDSLSGGFNITPPKIPTPAPTPEPNLTIKLNSPTRVITNTTALYTIRISGTGIRSGAEVMISDANPLYGYNTLGPWQLLVSADGRFAKTDKDAFKPNRSWRTAVYNVTVKNSDKKTGTRRWGLTVHSKYSVT